MSGKYMVRCDMEGASGIVSYRQVVPGVDDYAIGRAYFMSDLLALVNGLYAGGADEIVIYDEHFDGCNVDITDLPHGTRLIAGKPPYQPDCAGGLDASFTGMILLGLHSMAGTGECLHHSYEPDIESIWLNGREVGEIGVEAAIAGDFGVPTLLLVGDSAASEEASALIPDIRYVSVKRSLGATSAECLSLRESAAMITSAAEMTAKRPVGIEPYRYGNTAELEIHLKAGPFQDAYRRHSSKDISEDGVVRLTSSNLTSIWCQYWQIKLTCLADIEAG